MCKREVRDTYKYHFRIPSVSAGRHCKRIVVRGFTKNLEKREAEHRLTWPDGRINQVGRVVTWKDAEKWEAEDGTRLSR
ncbi:hypothetical protein LCGC14_0932950 [marine sediment metagenome]|uniref:Uncharacterized protein n=1 Tax=marine sediment metagenome TaxID=412755 RepID=A0A0F9RTW7_9ZZZZ